MITKNPINNSNKHINTFKAKINKQQIYREMAELTIKKEDKILPKITVKDKLKNVISQFRKNSKPTLNTISSSPKEVLQAVWDCCKENSANLIGILISLSLICGITKMIKDTQNTVPKQEVVTKVDSLNNSYKGKNISVEEY